MPRNYIAVATQLLLFRRQSAMSKQYELLEEKPTIFQFSVCSFLVAIEPTSACQRPPLWKTEFNPAASSVLPPENLPGNSCYLVQFLHIRSQLV